MTTRRDVRITIHEAGLPPRDLTLCYPLDPDHAALLRALHEGGDVRGVLECRMHDDDPRLRDLRQPDGRIHGVWLYLRTNPHAAATRAFPLLLCHWPGTGLSGTHAIPSTMTPEHRARQEYIARRGDDAGYQVDVEKSLARGIRSDVVVTGSAVLAAEVQQSDITVAEVVRRTRKATEAGATSTWFADRRNLPWAFRVPFVATNERTGLACGQWTVATGARILDHERCDARARRPCPDGRNWCGRWHPIWEPMPGMTVDDVVEQVPAGQLVRLDTGTGQGTILCRPVDRDEWLTAHPPVDAQTPRKRRIRDADGQLRHPDYAADSLRRRLTAEVRRCGGCGEPLGSHPFDLHPRCYFRTHLGWSSP
jgi:hypothetical protein